MEEELDKSNFVGAEELTTLVENSVQNSSLSPNVFGQDTNNKALWDKITKLAYLWLDNLSERKSYFLNSGSERLKRYEDIIAFLKTQGMAEEVQLNASRFNDTPRLMSATIRASYPPEFRDAPTNRLFANASGSNTEIVLSKAIGEFLER